MKKGIKENKVQRMRNLATGNYNKGVHIRSGYTTKHIERSEGDIWEEGGKTWTIKRGIKRTVNKLDNVRKINRVPLQCPECSTSMSHPAHKQMFKRFGMCFNCVSSWQNEMRTNGTYEQFLKEFDQRNFDAFITNVKKEYDDWLESRDSESFISEAGHIEEWSGGQSNQDIDKEFNEKLDKVIADKKEKNG